GVVFLPRFCYHPTQSCGSTLWFSKAGFQPASAEFLPRPATRPRLCRGDREREFLGRDDDGATVQLGSDDGVSAGVGVWAVRTPRCRSQGGGFVLVRLVFRIGK